MSETATGGRFRLLRVGDFDAVADTPFVVGFPLYGGEGLVRFKPAPSSATATLEEARQRVIAERMALAHDFAERVSGYEGVQDVIVMSVEPDLLLGVILSELHLERELHLQAVLFDLARHARDQSIGDVIAFVEGEDERPEGQSLLR
jgi:hypothetical protein